MTVARRDPYEELVVRDAFGSTTAAEAAELRAPENLERFWNEINRIILQIDGQLSLDAESRGQVVQTSWRRRALSVRYHLVVQRRSIEPAVRALRRELHRSGR